MTNGRGRRFLFLAVVVLYVVTWIWGVPAVHTAIASNTIAAYRAAAQKPRASEHIGPSHPSVRFRATLVPLPFVVASYHESRVGRLMGWGGITVWLWWPGGIKRITEWTSWMS